MHPRHLHEKLHVVRRAPPQRGGERPGDGAGALRVTAVLELKSHEDVDAQVVVIEIALNGAAEKMGGPDKLDRIPGDDLHANGGFFRGRLGRGILEHDAAGHPALFQGCTGVQHVLDEKNTLVDILLVVVDNGIGRDFNESRGEQPHTDRRIAVETCNGSWNGRADTLPVLSLNVGWCPDETVHIVGGQVLGHGSEGGPFWHGVEFQGNSGMWRVITTDLFVVKFSCTLLTTWYI